MEKKALYVVLTDANFDTEVLKSNKPVLVEFYARWSGSCQIVEPIFDTLAVQYTGMVKLGKFDIDENKLVTQKYGIQTLPTFLFFQNGCIVDHIIGVVPRSVIRTKLKGLLRQSKTTPHHYADTCGDNVQRDRAERQIK